MHILARIRSMFRSKETPGEHAVRESFQLRYHNFKRLLGANAQALEAMSEMEEALNGRRTYGFAFVRSTAARVTAQVYAMIRHLDALAPGKYTGLFESFEAIQGRIEAALPRVAQNVQGRHVVALAEIDRNDSDQCGTKMAHLGELRNRMGLRVPDGFVVTAAAWQAFMDANGLFDEVGRLIQIADTESPSGKQLLSASIARLMEEAVVPEAVAVGIAREYESLCKRLGRSPHLAVRSSAIGEDESGSCHAGQYKSLLNVHPDNLIESYKEIVASLYGVQAMGFRFLRGVETPPMCVGFLDMVDATAGGVCYTMDPLSEHQDAVLVSSVWGRPKSIVDGVGHADSFFVDRTERTVIERRIAFKDACSRPSAGEGLAFDGVPEDMAATPSMDDDRVIEMADTGLMIEHWFGYPQDIEFALDDGGLVFLQARAIMLTPPPLVRELPESTEILMAGGVRAAGGVGAGTVHVVRKNADILSFAPDSVLVAQQPGPELAVLLPSAAAVVTETGGVAGHLASVAREFGVPAVFGLVGALDVLKDGMEVTVDADGLRVLRGRIETLLADENGEVNLMAGTPVHRTLSQVIEHVVPLHLIDPNGIRFRPSHCTSLHDITRFCHEKAIREMFSFGQTHRFDRHDAKQLHVAGTPRQFWVVDLQDGFTVQPQDKWIELGDIASVPMLALWKGMNAVPWEGPPAVDARGFLAVMFEASMNPRLNVTSGGVRKNYFMISKEYCSLQSRFGFHFCSVEALVGEHDVENHASFRFFGGAADQDRRRLRVRLIAEVLEEFGFRAWITEDSLSARIDGRDSEFMTSRLIVLGHLLMHTRQLDMIMKGRGQARAYREKLCNEIAGILG